MTERSTTGTERQGVCPFVAFDDDRDFRSSVPDHRHRCFAERPAATRALAHQAAYCLSSAFPSCPTFIDWARREAAPAKEEPIRTLREAPTAPRQGARPAEKASRPTGPQDGSTTSQRQRRADWTAPPPWAPDAGADARPTDLARPTDRFEPGGVPSLPDAEDAHEDIAAPEQDAGARRGTWTGSARAGLDAAAPPPWEPRNRERPAPEPAPESAAASAEALPPAFLAGRPARPGPAEDGARPSTVHDVSGPTRRPGQLGPSAPDHDSNDMARPRPPRRGRSDTSRAIGRIADRRPERSIERAAQDPAAPSWERPRRFEAYPSLKSSGGGLTALPRPVLYGLIVLIVGIALFATPFLFRGLTGGGGASPGATPAASASGAPSSAPSITPVPSPSPTIYTVKAGDVLSRIAAKYGVTIAQITAANPQIKNPDKLAVGDQLVIPPVTAPAITDGTITPAPSG